MKRCDECGETLTDEQYEDGEGWCQACVTDDELDFEQRHPDSEED